MFVTPTVGHPHRLVVGAAAEVSPHSTQPGTDSSRRRSQPEKAEEEEEAESAQQPTVLFR